MQRGERWRSHKAASPTNATKALWGRHEYHNDTHPATTIIIKGASIAATQAQWTQQPGGPLNRKPQADWAYSCLRSPVTRALITTKKHTMKNSWRNDKKYSHVTLAPCVTRMTLAQGATKTIDWRRPERQQNKHVLRRQQRRHKLPSSFDKKIEGRLCCCGSLRETDHQRPSRVKRAKRKRCFLHFWTMISNFTDTVLMGLDSMDADLKNRPNDVMNPFDFDKWRSTASRTSEVPRIKYLEVVHTNQDYTIVNNCLVWKQQTLTVQFLW